MKQRSEDATLNVQNLTAESEDLRRSCHGVALLVAHNEIASRTAVPECVICLATIE
jgi:hypothetical protein